ncbi:MAG: 3-phosphoshikimate 1-carboxyvinyltransferase, partial [Bacteroidia bacterium]
ACITPGKWLIMGTPRLLERPIDSYLDSLRNIGFDVRSSAKGLQISGIDPSLIHCADWEVDLSETSQFATALLLIAPAFKSKINLTLAGKAVSSSYLQLTVDCLQQCGWDVHNETSSIVINSKEPVFVIPQNLVEPDWSSAAYFFAMALLSDSAQLFFPSLISSSNQPDSSIMDTFTQFGGLIHEDAGGMHISMNAACRQVPNQFTKDYTNQPDLAMTEIVLMHALKVPMHISGVQHLKHKESDRLAALKSMLSVWEKRGQNLACFETFSDHRMAMSLSLFALKENISIENPEVVHKSFPKFWKEMEKIGFILKDV